MAKVLRCPECGNSTPFDEVHDDVFACPNCGRTLKVPAAYRRAPAATTGVPQPTRGRDATTVMPAAAPAGAPSAAPTAAPRRATSAKPGEYRMRLWLRIVVWIVAVPLALVLVVVPARAFSWVTTGTAIDIVTGEKAGRFVQILPLLISWSLVAAVLATLGTDGVSWLVRRRRAAAPAPGTAAAAAPGSRTSR